MLYYTRAPRLLRVAFAPHCFSYSFDTELVFESGVFSSKEKGGRGGGEGAKVLSFALLAIPTLPSRVFQQRVPCRSSISVSSTIALDILKSAQAACRVDELL